MERRGLEQMHSIKWPLDTDETDITTLNHLQPTSYECDNDMDNRKIQLFVVTFCALWYIGQGQSPTVTEEAGISEEWQVNITNLTNILQL